MKISSKIYAKVLSELVKNKSPEEIDRLVGKMAGIIAKNGDQIRKDEILKSAEKYLRETENRHSLLVESARALPESFYADILKKLGEGQYDLERSINEDLAAGVKLSVDESRELDLSLKKLLGNLFDKKEK